MTAIEQIANFRVELQTAILKMIMGRCVELSEEGRKEWEEAGIENIGRWFFIKSINDDESITLVSQTHHVFENLTLKHIKL